MTHRRRISKRTGASRAPAVLAAVAAAVVALGVARLHAESVTLTTFYPSPRAVFQELWTLGATNLATDAPARLGVGMIAPATRMHVNGNVQALQFIWPRALPAGAIAIFRGGCPPGWGNVGAFNGRAIVGSGAYGATYNSPGPDHVHTLPHGHGTDDPPPAISGISGNHGHPVSQGWHNHSFGSVGTGGTGDFVNPGIDGGSQATVRGDHGHTTWGGVTSGDGGGYNIDPADDHQHNYDFPPTGYGSAPGLTLGSTQVPTVNVVFCSSP